MAEPKEKLPPIAKGSLPFTIESRILRELGERLVKQPEVALLELIKNSYDADARTCSVKFDPSSEIVVSDDGVGMTLDKFTNSWMRIGTSSKENLRFSDRYFRLITGEKGIGRFAVRFLGTHLRLESVAEDPAFGGKTRLVAKFDWPTFDRTEDLGSVEVPYDLYRADADAETGTTLTISRPRSSAKSIDLQKVRTGSMGVLTPIRSLFLETAQRVGLDAEEARGRDNNSRHDPGFVLKIGGAGQSSAADGVGIDVGAQVLRAFVLRATVQLAGDELTISVFRRGQTQPYQQIIDSFKNELRSLYADLRFLPRRKGTFTGLDVDGRLAQSWVADNSGVAVFDRAFRVLPYGVPGDDWLDLAADAARNRRAPRSTIAKKHFDMTPAEFASTAENWMLRLPQSMQLVGVVQVETRRHGEGSDTGLVASADREGFVENEAFEQLYQVIRGAVELIAYSDRRLQREDEEQEREALAEKLRADTQAAIAEIRSNPNIAAADKSRIVAVIADNEQLAGQKEQAAKERERQLEVMSLLGVVAGYMTHEFGVALKELEDTLVDLNELAKTNPKFENVATKFALHIKALQEFVTYSSGYIRGSKARPTKPYAARPRLQQVQRIFGAYAESRNIDVEITAEPDVMVPLVPASLYNGIALNLYTNALKAVTAKVGADRGTIAFRAWNDAKWHYLEVSDTGVGIPVLLKDRVFDPLFTTTQSKDDPLGSGMGLGLALVQRGAEAFGGKAELVTAPPGFATCMRVRLPLDS